MFKKLKDKIAEEVKESPLKKVQQLAQAVVSPTSSSVFEPSSSNEKFCIDEGDVEEEESAKPKQTKSEGFTSVALTGQTNSPQSQKYGAKQTFASEADNLFQKFETQPTNFNVQSDWESASEVEDRGGQLEHISKESIYEAYRKMHSKYNRMRNKYHELVTHYRQLERENHKAKTVLSDTQDKALLRISELREQCQLEQQAKAHLEEALRNELEERDHIIKALRTKVQYLKSSTDDSTIDDICELPGENTDNLIDLSENTCVLKVPLPSTAFENKGNLDWFEEKLKVCKEMLNEKIAKVDDLRIDLENTKKLCSLNKNSTNVDCDKLEKNSFDSEKMIYEPLVKLLFEIGKDVKTFRESTCSHLSRELNEIQKDTEDTKENISLKSFQHNERTSARIIIVKEGSDDGLFESVNRLKEDQERQNDELKKHYDTIQELQKKNENLNIELLKEGSVNKDARVQLELLNKTFDPIEKQLRDPNDQFSLQSFNLESISQPSVGNNELVKEVNQSIANFINLLSRLCDVKEIKSSLENEIKMLKSKLIEFEDLTVSKQREKDQLETQLEGFENKITILIGEHDSLSDRITELSKQNEDLQNNLQSAQASLYFKNEEFKLKEDKVTKLQAELENVSTDLKKRIAQLEAIAEKKNVEKRSLAEKTKEVYDELSSIKKEYDDLINERKDKIDLENKYKQLIEDHEVAIKQKESLINEVSKLKTLVSACKEENKNLNETVLVNQQAYDKERFALEKKVSDLESVKLSSLKMENESLMKEKTACVTEFESKLKELQHELALGKELNLKVTNELSDLKHECANLASEKNTMSAKFSSLKEYMIEFENSLAAEKAAKEKLSEEIRFMEEKYTAEVNENKLLNDRINKLMHDYESASKSESKLTLDIGLLKEELSQLEEKNSSLKQNIETLQQDLLKQKSESFSKDDHSLITCDELKVMRMEKENLEEKYSNLNTRFLHIEDNLKKREADILNASNEISLYEQEINALKSNIENLTQQIAHKNNEAIANSDKNQSLLLELNSLKQEKDDMSLELNRAKQEKNDLEVELNSVQTKVLNFEEALHKSEKDVSALRQAKEALKLEFDMMSTQKETLQSKFDNLTNDFENLKNDHATLLEVNNQLSNDLSTCKKEYNDSIRKFNETKQLLESEERNVKAFKAHMEKLAESLESSSVVMAEKSQDLPMLKDDVGSLTKSLNEANNLIETTHKERISLLKNVNGAHSCIQYIKNDHQHLLELINAFKSDILLKIGAIKLIMENEILQSKHVLQSKTDDKTKESDNKIKESNDDYNMKIKCLHDEKADAEKKLKQAISIMESIRHFLFQISEEKSQGNNKTAKFKEIGKDFIKHLSSMESFINEYGKNQNHIDSKENLLNFDNNNRTSLSVSAINLKLEAMCEDELESFLGASSILSQSQVPKQEEQTMTIQAFQTNCFDQTEFTVKETENKNIETHIQDDIFKSHQHELELHALAHDTCVDHAKYFKLEEENKKLKIEYNDLQASYELATIKIIDYERKLEENLEETSFSAMENAGKQQRNTISELKEQIENLQQDLEGRGDAFEKLYEEHQKVLKSQADEVQQLRQSYERDMREQDKKWRSCLDRRLAEADLRQQQLTAQWEAQRKELETASRLAVSAVESGSNSGDLLRKQIQALTMQLKNKRCEVCCNKKVASEQSTRSLQDCTEMEYLRNILYEYMMGKEPLVLSRVLCALMKFDDNQTKEIVRKEEHKITVFGQMGLL